MQLFFKKAPSIWGSIALAWALASAGASDDDGRIIFKSPVEGAHYLSRDVWMDVDIKLVVVEGSSFCTQLREHVAPGDGAADVSYSDHEPVCALIDSPTASLPVFRPDSLTEGRHVAKFWIDQPLGQPQKTEAAV